MWLLLKHSASSETCNAVASLHILEIFNRAAEVQTCVSMTAILPFKEVGTKSGPPIVFMSGFPDTETSAWGETIAKYLGKQYRCIFMCLPGYGEFDSAALQKPWGFDHDEVLLMMQETIRAVGLLGKPYYLISHDWGAFFSLLYTTRHPQEVSKLILCDIGMCGPFTLPLSSVPFIAFYQLFFAVAYILSQALSKSLAESLFLAVGIKAFYNILSPPLFQRAEVHQSSLTVLKCYPYYHLWKRLLTGTMLPQSFPVCPLLFLVRL